MHLAMSIALVAVVVMFVGLCLFFVSYQNHVERNFGRAVDVIDRASLLADALALTYNEFKEENELVAMLYAEFIETRDSFIDSVDEF